MRVPARTDPRRLVPRALLLGLGAAALNLIALSVIAPGAFAREATLGPEVTIMGDDDASFPNEYATVGRLTSGTVLRMQVFGFDSFTRAVAEQCTPNAAAACGNQIRVQFDEFGQANFQYLITNSFLDSQPVPGACRVNAAPCTIAIRSLDNSARGEIQTIFVDAVPMPGRISVTPAHGISIDGETVTVEVHDYPPGAKVNAMLCAAPEAMGPRCGAPGPTAPLVVGPDGTGRTRLVLAPGSVGINGARCSRTSDCGISVASDTVFARAPVVPISFAGPPGADYDPRQLALGLGLAAALVAIATWLIFRTDWSPVGEAAAPQIDDAEYADLDAIIAALPPEEDELVSNH
jgi:hypothetical protein